MISVIKPPLPDIDLLDGAAWSDGVQARLDVYAALQATSKALVRAHETVMLDGDPRCCCRWRAARDSRVLAAQLRALADKLETRADRLDGDGGPWSEDDG